MLPIPKEPLSLGADAQVTSGRPHDSPLTESEHILCVSSLSPCALLERCISSSSPICRPQLCSLGLTLRVCISSSSPICGPQLCSLGLNCAGLLTERNDLLSTSAIPSISSLLLLSSPPLQSTLLVRCSAGVAQWGTAISSPELLA